EENRHGMVKRPSFHIGPDALGHLPQQVVTTMNIAHAVYPSSIRDATRSRRNRRRCFLKRIQERFRPPHGFGGPHVWARCPATPIIRGESEITWAAGHL